MGTGIFRDGQLAMFFGGSLPDPSPVEQGDELIEADTLEAAIDAYDTAHETNLADVRSKLLEVQQGYAVAMVVGYDTGLGFSLKLGEQDQRILFDYQQRLLRQVALLQATLADSKVLKGTDDAWHVATVQQIIDAIDGGAGHIESLNGAYAGYEAMLSVGVTDFTVDFSQA